MRVRFVRSVRAVISAFSLYGLQRSPRIQIQMRRRRKMKKRVYTKMMMIQMLPKNGKMPTNT